MAEQATVLAFFQSRNVADAAWGELRRNRIGHAAVAHRARDGSEMTDAGDLHDLLARYLPWVVRNESLVLFQAGAEDAARGLDLLREQATGSPPLCFVFVGDGLSGAPAEEMRAHPPVPAERLAVQARKLARDLRTAPPPSGSAPPPLLRRLQEGRRVLGAVRDELDAAVRLGLAPSLAMDWLLDNEYVIRGHITAIALNLPHRFLETLPVVAAGALAGLPRAYALASALIADADARLSAEGTAAYLLAFQEEQELTLGELWATPLLLRLRLIEYLSHLALRVARRQRERVWADFWASRLLSAARRDPDRLLPLATRLAEEAPDPSPYLIDQLTGHLYDEEAAIAPVRSWLERKRGASLGEIVDHEHREQAAEQVSLSNAIGSLRLLAQLEWAEIFEEVSRVEAVLREDPAGVYASADFETRDQCRHAVEEIARRTRPAKADPARHERSIAEAARDRAGSGQSDWERHVGYWLIDDGRAELEARRNYPPPLRQRLQRAARRHPTRVYLGSIGLLTAALLALVAASAAHAGTSPLLLALLLVLALLPASELAVGIVNYAVTRLLPPLVLPKMRFERGVPDDCRTAVVVPMMLISPEAIRTQVERLEIRSLANPDPNLRFGLLSDFSDAPEQHMPGDAERLEIVIRGIEELNGRYGPGRFFLFHRERRWSDSENRWIGWERKRGKLEQWNAFLRGAETPDAQLRVGNAAELRGVRFVITLDADTQLPPGTARRLIEALAHPLNLPRLSPDGQSVIRGYTILQPRVSTSLPSATATFFSRLFTDPSGIDPYTHAVSDVYQDLAGEGSYHGKGIYDPAAFHRILHDRLPTSHILSHDLLEGAHVRVGLVSDIELFDLFPGDYVTYANRQHRWARGDWQIIDWLFGTVPGPDGQRRFNPLSAFGRWKIFDNLRRSLLPVATVLMLLAAWFGSPAPGLWSAFALLVLLLPAALQSISLLLSGPRAAGMLLREVGTALLRALVFAALLPHQAGLTLDAVARVWHRRAISHRRLLEWQTFDEAQSRAEDRHRWFLRRMAWIPVASLAAFLLAPPAAGLVAWPFLLVWFASPALVLLLNAPAHRAAATELGAADQRMLRRAARRTWRFFDDFVGPQTNHLPPDNYQEVLREEVAQRTSPTNIGLWQLSLLAAHDFGYITPDDVLHRQAATLDTLDRLERYEGHLLNWYDIATREPLHPRYVSFVDSGNLLACLWALAQGCRDLAAAPLLGPQALEGLADTLALLREALETPSPPEGLAALEKLTDAPPGRLEDLVGRLRDARAPARALQEAVAASCAEPNNCGYWAEQVGQQVEAWNALIDHYLFWVDVLCTPPPEGLLGLDQEALRWRRQALESAPSLHALAAGDVPGLQALVHLDEAAGELGLPPGVEEWLGRLREAAAGAQARAGERLGQARAVIRGAERLAENMRFGFLYDEERHLFAVGYNVDDRRRDPFEYGLLASEARLGSFASIARGETPLEHWWAMGRPMARVYNELALLSWSGTMFEYLMPLLLTRAFDNSLLHQACRAAVAVQIEYGRRQKVPWGISEAAHSELDVRRIYQYYAFGVPGLARKRGQEEHLVVAPYATALALMVDAPAAVANLRRLEAIGMRGAWGFYESIDYTRQEGPEGERGVKVRAYMAHHQGMIFLAIDNVLQGGAMQRRFHADGRVQAMESLLHERIPATPAAPEISGREAAAPRPAEPAAAPAALRRIESPDTPAPQTHLLSNGAYSLMVTAAGGGYSRYKDVEITRWRADTTRDAAGSFVYLRDVDTGALWSCGHHPLPSPGAAEYEAIFTTEKAEFRRRVGEIETLVEIVVSPEDNAEVRRITLTNRSARARTVELTSYAEIALAPHNADRAHPAFSKMFVQTEALPERGALLAGRRPRAATDAPPWAAHVVAGHFVDPPEWETDRARFLGRGRTPENPVALEGPLGNTAGAVLDPIFSLRRRVTIAPNERAQIAFVTLAADTRDEAVALIGKYADFAAAERAFDLAWTHAQLELRHLRIHPHEAQRYQQLAGCLLYPHQQFRPSSERLRRNSRGQSALWAYGISGDLPILLVTVTDLYDAYVVREVLQAHTFLRLRGLKCDLVILNEEEAGYEQPLGDQLRRMVNAHSQHTGVDVPGGVFLRPAAQIPQEDLVLLHTVARVVIVAARGALEQHLGAPGPTLALPEDLPRTNGAVVAEEPLPLPFLELPYFNGLGGFSPDGREYVVYLGPGDHTPLPWINVMANPGFGCFVTESGGGFTWSGNSQSNRLTPWSNDPIVDPVGDALYIRDEETGAVWTPTPLPIREPGSAYRTRHGQGYTVWEHNSHGVEQTLVTFVPVDAGGGPPVRVQILRLANRSARRLRLSVFSYVEWVLGVEREDTQLHVVTTWDSQARAILARNAYHPDFGARVAFAAAGASVASFTGDRAEFLGRNGSPGDPAALGRTRLSNRAGGGFDPCAALQTSVIELQPGQGTELVFLLGQAESVEGARTLIERFRDPCEVERSLETTRAWWDDLLGTIVVDTPDRAVDFLVNRWLLYQDLSCRLWGRSAFYQSGGAFGFRDQLQDVCALLYARADLARTQILRSAARQFREGDVQHWWHPPGGSGVRTRISDDLLWLPFVTAHYVRVTGDTGVLDEVVPFLEGKILEEHEHELYFPPDVSEETGTILEHCRRAVQKGDTKGPHGLPLIGGGDWNDGLNRVGVGGKGESVWLAWFLVHVLHDFAYLLRLKNDEAGAKAHERRAAELADTVEREAWDGAWYRRATFDDGTPLGSAQNTEARIDSLPQSWASICGRGDPARAEQALHAVLEHLVHEGEGGLLLLFTPPLDKSPQDPGYIKGYPPGVRENGGQYTHGSLWTPMAFARRGDGEQAVRLLTLMNPVEHARTPEAVARYKVEPYVVAADVYALPGHVGRGGWTWYTGSAGWMYRVWVEEVLGFTLRGGDTLTMDPCIHPAWDGFTLRHRHKSATYVVSVENPEHVSQGVVEVTLDGEILPEKAIPLRDDGAEHAVRVRLGHPSPPVPFPARG